MVTHRNCTKCKTEKSLEEFAIKSSGKYGRKSACKVCCAALDRKRYDENVERERARCRAYGLANLEKENARKRQYIIDNPFYKRDWQRKNSDKVIAYAHKHRTLINNSTEHYTAEEWISLCERYNYTCLACGKNDVPMTVDHVIPVSLGGSNGIDNIQPLCKPCNCSKGARHSTDYRIMQNV